MHLLSQATWLAPACFTHYFVLTHVCLGAQLMTSSRDGMNEPIGHYKIVKCLIDAGVDVLAPDSQGWTALHVAAGYGRVSRVTL